MEGILVQGESNNKPWSKEMVQWLQVVICVMKKIQGDGADKDWWKGR